MDSFEIFQKLPNLIIKRSNVSWFYLGDLTWNRPNITALLDDLTIQCFILLIEMQYEAWSSKLCKGCQKFRTDEMYLKNIRPPCWDKDPSLTSFYFWSLPLASLSTPLYHLILS